MFADGKVSSEFIGLKVIPIEDVIVGSDKAASLSNKPIEGIVKYVFSPKELLLSKISDDAIPEAMAILLTTASEVLVVNPALETIPEERLTLLLSAKVEVPKVSSDGMDVAPIL